jgi:hypothetical protein
MEMVVSKARYEHCLACIAYAERFPKLPRPKYKAMLNEMKEEVAAYKAAHNIQDSTKV